LYKLASISLCSNLNGQIMVMIVFPSTAVATNPRGLVLLMDCVFAQTGLMVQPPKKGDASYAQYHAESSEIIASLACVTAFLQLLYRLLQCSVVCDVQAPSRQAIQCFPDYARN
jgi:hypothetical protein